MATSGFDRGLAGRRRQQIIKNSTQRAHQAMARAAATPQTNQAPPLPGNSNDPGAGPTTYNKPGGNVQVPLTPQRIKALTQKLQGLRTQGRAAYGQSAPQSGPNSASQTQEDLSQRVNKIRGVLAGRRFTPGALPTPPGGPGSPFVPGTRIPIGDTTAGGGGPQFPPTAPGTPTTATPGTPPSRRLGNQASIRARINNNRQPYRANPLR